MQRSDAAGRRALRAGWLAGALRAGWLAGALVLLTAVPAWAAEGGGAHGDPWMELLWKAVNFLVLAGVLWYFGRKPLANMLRGAAQEARAELEARREAAHRAETDLTRQRDRITNLQAELERMAGAARGEAQAEHARLLAEARAQAERIRTTVHMQMEQEFSKARKALQAELAQQTVRLAEELIRQRMDDAGRQRIVTQAIDQLGAAR